MIVDLTETQELIVKSTREYVELQSYIVVIATLFVLINFFVDFLYSVLDPRIRRARAAV